MIEDIHMNEKFLKWFIKFCGLFEIFIGVSFIFMPPLFELIGISCEPLFIQMAGVELTLLGFLLWYSAKNLLKYRIIIIVSIALRFIMPPFEIYAAFTIPAMTILLIFTTIYDIATAALTLILMKKLGYLSNKES